MWCARHVGRLADESSFNEQRKREDEREFCRERVLEWESANIFGLDNGEPMRKRRQRTKQNYAAK